MDTKFNIFTYDSTHDFQVITRAQALVQKPVSLLSIEEANARNRSTRGKLQM